MPPFVPAPHSVAVVTAANTLPFVNFSAGAVGAGGAVVNFSYSITDVNGTSNTVTNPVTIQDSGFVATSIANCYDRVGAATPVSSMAALANAINAAATGRPDHHRGQHLRGRHLHVQPAGDRGWPDRGAAGRGARQRDHQRRALDPRQRDQRAW